MYRNVIDNFALGVLTKQPNIPDFHLMVGSAERLDSLPLLVYENYNIPSEVARNMEIMQEKSSADIEQAIADNNLEVNDLNWNMATLGMGVL